VYGIKFFFDGIGIGISHSHQVADPELHLAPSLLAFILQHINYHKE
jgi:hypothetical protein